MPFSALPPLGPLDKDGSRAAELDIHWHRWHDSAPAFLGRAAAEKVALATGVPLPSAVFEPRAKGQEWVGREETRSVGLTVLAVLNSVHEATSEQLAFWTGDARLRDSRSQILRILWSANLIETATTSHFRRTPGLVLWRLASNDVFEREVSPLLTFSELVSVTGSGSAELSTKRRFARHDGHMTELLRRTAAWIPEVACSFGEAFGGHYLVSGRWPAKAQAPAQAKVKKSNESDVQATVDGVLIRAIDGLPILCELQASSGSPRLVNKILALCRVLLGSPELTLLVVTVAKRTGNSPADAGLTNSVRASVVAGLRKFMDEQPPLNSGAREVWQRVFIADWSTDFFPTPGEDGPVTTPAFLHLAAERPLIAGGWERVSLLDPAAVTPPAEWAANPRARASMANAALLRQTAPVQRVRLRADNRLEIPKLWQLPMVAAHLDGLVYDRPGQGTVAAATVPTRLRNLDD
ncbi:hypothetical protein ASF30_02125 [Leifsonia sp. Leaf264]|nr:hypothetical protein ASF30_02125 [Leifsonia sp. Leaf264]